jgi:peptidoglycan/LPS O-acetylase OafA/YrhL
MRVAMPRDALLRVDETSTPAGRDDRTRMPALDGIRACAVAAVVLFHAGVPGFGGGFLGVDTFFVLSGYLITGLLLDERSRKGRIRFRQFWIRRARRLLPALLLTVLATVVCGRLLLDPDALALLRTDAWAALGYLANWRMIFRGTGYVAATATASPLQHTWSLAIEEQFYLVWPLVVALVTWRASAGRARVTLFALCCAGAVGSAVLAALLFRPDDIARAYYGTDSRAQALLIGAALAAICRPAAGTLSRRPRSARRVLGVLGVIGVVVTAVLWHVASDQDAWLYRSGLAVAAVATALVIAQVVADAGSRTARLLGLPALAWTGRISYGIYLWHWPLFSFVTADATSLSRWPLLGVRLASTLALATASYYLVEQPIRRGAPARLLPAGGPAVAALAAVCLVAAAVGFATLPAPVTAAKAGAPVVITVAPRPAVPPGRSAAGGLPAPIDRPGRGAAAGTQPRVTFLGDSVSWVIGTYLPPHPGLRVSDRAIQGCGIATLPDILELGTPHTNYPGCTAWPQRWRRAVAADNPDVAVIELNRWELMDRKYQGRYQHVGDPAYDSYLTGRLEQAIGIAGSRGAHVVLLTAAYTHRAEMPDGSLYPEDQPQRVDDWNTLLREEAARHPRTVTVLNLTAVVCPAGKFSWDVHGVRIRSDGLHYTPSGVRQIIAPWLLPKLAAVAQGTYRDPAATITHR